MKIHCFFTAGILNLLLMAFVFLFAVLMVVCLVMAVTLTFSLFFMVALPMAIVCGIFAGCSFFAAFLLLVTGICSILAYCRQWKIAKSLAMVSLVLEAFHIVPCLFTSAFGILMIVDTPDAISIIWTILAVVALALAVAGVTVNAVGLNKQRKMLS